MAAPKHVAKNNITLCPDGHGRAEVINTRLTHRYVYRRRECLACGTRWSTYEMSIEEVKLLHATAGIAAGMGQLLIDTERAGHTARTALAEVLTPLADLIDEP